MCLYFSLTADLIYVISYSAFDVFSITYHIAYGDFEQICVAKAVNCYNDFLCP